LLLLGGEFVDLCISHEAVVLEAEAEAIEGKKGEKKKKRHRPRQKRKPGLKPRKE
jgi:hypothetical protein